MYMYAVKKLVLPKTMKNRKSINKDIISIFVAMDRKILYQQTERRKQPNVSFYL